MQISSKEVFSLITLTSIIFLIAPLFLIRYVLLYNKKKRRHKEEKMLMHEIYETELLKTKIEVQEQTLKTVAFDLHDNIGQLLSLMSVALSTIDANDPKAVAEKVDLISDLTQRSIGEVKALSKLLHSEELIKMGLIEAIAFELSWLQRLDRFNITFNKPSDLGIALKNNQKTIVFRLFQEIINNIIQHAKATKIIINLALVDNCVQLEIHDNGIGFNIDELPNRVRGMGLTNIKKRAEMLSGTATIYSTIGKGTSIRILVPIDNNG
jgi:signal transduction histidine kinase